VTGVQTCALPICYDQSIAAPLLGVLDQVKPRQIALNFSESDSAADGLSHGMYVTLTRYLGSAPYQLISAERLINALRGRKTPDELARIRQAVKTTEAVIDDITSLLKPGLSELAIAQAIQADFARRGVGPAWEAGHCPIVNCGAESSVGHAGPSAQVILQPDNLVHIDLGVVENEYVSDMQRLWYVLPKDGRVPEPVQKAFYTIRAAIEAAAKTLKPGAQGYEVDGVARKTITAAGYPEYQHALGHHIGRTAHDGGTLLGPRWERYGTAPEGIVEAGNVYTLEPSILLQGYGMIALEEDVLVTEHGLEWLGTPQTEIVVVES